MRYDRRLTAGALQFMQRFNIAPYIIKASPDRLMDIGSEIVSYLMPEIKLLPQLVAPESPIGPFPPKIFLKFGLVASLLPRDLVEDYAEDERVEKIFPDRLEFALQYPTVPPEGVYKARKRKKEYTFTTTAWTKRILGAEEANEKGYDGAGVRVAVVDTGASRIHNQLRGRVAFYSTILLQHRDENGHGSWCATCIAGHKFKDTYLSIRAGKDVYCEGMAPGVHLIAVKSLGYYIGTGSSSQVIEGIDIALKNKAQIISMSLGSSDPPETKPEDNAYYSVFEKCKEEGAIPVVANGNDGPGEGTVGSPGNMPNCLSVGAYDPVSGEVADFSSRGPTKWGDIKPDCIMPGVLIDSGTVGLTDLSGDGMLSRASPISGTSMATPHAAGMLALMAQAYRTKIHQPLTLDEVKAMLEALKDHPKNNDGGWGVLTWSKIKDWASTQYGVEL